MANLRALNDLAYEPEDVRFAIRLQQSLNEKLPLDDIQRVVRSHLDPKDAHVTCVGVLDDELLSAVRSAAGV